MQSRWGRRDWVSVRDRVVSVRDRPQLSFTRSLYARAEPSCTKRSPDERTLRHHWLRLHHLAGVASDGFDHRAERSSVAGSRYTHRRHRRESERGANERRLVLRTPCATRGERGECAWRHAAGLDTVTTTAVAEVCRYRTDCGWRAQPIAEAWVMHAIFRVAPRPIGQASRSNSLRCWSIAAYQRVVSMGASRGVGTMDSF